jgi:replicative DNA helicase
MRELEPAHNFEAEQAVLGAVLFSNAAYHQLADVLRQEHFADPLHGKLWSYMGRMIERGQTCSPITLKSYADADLREAGDASYLLELMGVSVPEADALGVARVVVEAYAQRQAAEAVEAMRAPTDDPMARIAETAARLGELADNAAIDSPCRAFSAVVDDVLGTAEAVHKRGGGISGIATGFGALDDALGGLHPGELTILAARPSMGKSALAAGIGFKVAHGGVPVLFDSLEMTAESIGARLVSEWAEVPGHRIRQGTVNSLDLDRYMAAGNARRDLPFYIDDSAGLSIATIRARARQAHRRHRIGLLIVDYLQLCSGSADRRDGNRVQEVSEITRGLKALAKELKIPVLALSQLSRAVEARSDRRPVLSDLRESGSIEQDADVVLFLFREEYYLERSDRRGSPDHIASMGRAELIIGKQRHGATGVVELRFDGALTRFSNAGATAREAA